MHPYALIPLAACIVSASIAVSLWLRATSDRRILPVVSLGLLGAFWAFCEVLWSLAPNPEAAVGLQRLSALGWIGLGPLSLHVVQQAIGQPDRRMSRVIGALYAIAGFFLVLTWTTPWMVERALPTAWGYAAVPGEAFSIFYAITVAAASTAIYRWIRHLRSTPEGTAGGKGRLATIGLVSPLIATSLTDAILPSFDVHIPRLGTAAIAALAVLQLMSFVRYGHSLLVPEGLTAKVLEAIPDGIAALSLTGHVRALNEGMARFFGVPRQQLVGSCVIDALSENVLDPPREVRDLECTVLPRSGPPIPVSISTAIQTDRIGLPEGVVLVARDLRELVTLRNRLMMSGRLAAVGELAAGIAHEINNPITYVRANLSVLREHWSAVGSALGKIEMPDDLEEVLGDGEELIEESLEGVDRAAGIVRDIREFSHEGTEVLEMADLNELLDQTLRVARLQIPKGAHIDKRLGDLPLVSCQPQRIKQALMNLILNAAQAIEGDGNIRLITQHIDGEVVVRIEDDGCGISDEFIDRIFDPFFTTKPVGVGTGLGLAITFGIIQQHGGEIEVRSKPSQGTSIRAHLPVASDADETATR
jgi:signal transduction histidine kinase